MSQREEKRGERREGRGGRGKAHMVKHTVGIIPCTQDHTVHLTWYTSHGTPHTVHLTCL